jgi:serine protease inhibitor
MNTDADKLSTLNRTFMLSVYNNLDGASNVIAPDLFICSLVASGVNLSYDLTDIEKQFENYDSDNPIVRYNIDFNVKETDNFIPELRNFLDRIATVTIKKRNKLESTIKFNCKWEHKFNPKLNYTIPFHKTLDNEVEMMRQTNYYQYYENKLYQIVEINVASRQPSVNDSALKFGIILPKDWENTQQKIGQYNQSLLESHQLDEMVNNLAFTYVDLSVPKMNGIRRYCLPLVTSLIPFKRAKTKSKIELISNIFFDIDNEGDTIQTPLTEQKPVTFVADHVFIFYLRDSEKNIFLLYGDYQGK